MNHLFFMKSSIPIMDTSKIKFLILNIYIIPVDLQNNR